MKRAGAQIDDAITTIQQGGLIAYPTEAVFGLGCDFRSETAVNKLLSIKQRPVEKGLILIASHIQHILPLIKLKNQDHLAAALKTWPGHSSWVFEKSDLVPNWISGSYKTVALRVSSHPSVKAICDRLGSAIVSTSANSAGNKPFIDIKELQAYFTDKIDYYLDQTLGGLKNPSTIRLASNQQIIR